MRLGLSLLFADMIVVVTLLFGWYFVNALRIIKLVDVSKNGCMIPTTGLIVGYECVDGCCVIIASESMESGVVATACACLGIWLHGYTPTDGRALLDIMINTLCTDNIVYTSAVM